jgi:hypothetical protein
MTELLGTVIRVATAAVRVVSPGCGAVSSREIVWGEQLDIRPIRAFGDGDELIDTAVAGYIAKYATKGAAEGCGTVDYPLMCRSCAGHGVADSEVCSDCGGAGVAMDVRRLPVSEHAKNMIRTCVWLGALPEFAELRLIKWAHMLGFRGHFSMKSRRYSTTLGALRQARADYRAAEVSTDVELAEDTTLVLAHWAYAGHG